MKKLVYLPLFFAVFGLSGCVSEEVNFVNSEVNVLEDVAIIKELGFNIDDIGITDDAYIVEGDIVISKKSLTELKNEPQTRHTVYSGSGHTISQTWLNNRIGSDGRSIVSIGIQSLYRQRITGSRGQWFICLHMAEQP